jgi:protein deglycase
VSRVLVPLAPGFEEIEAVTIVDVLRRGGVEVVVAGLKSAGPVEGAHGIAVRADAALVEVRGRSFDMVVLPGGEPGVTNLSADDAVQALVAERMQAGTPLGAICAAPRILAGGGFLRGRRATSHPSVAAQLKAGGALYEEARRVVRDGALVTSRGPGTAIEFSLEVLEMLGLGARAAELRQAMLVSAPA